MANYEREQKRRIIMGSTCLVTIILLLLAMATSVTPSNNPNHKTQFHSLSKMLNFFKITTVFASSSTAVIAGACKSTLYPAACKSSLAGSPAKSLKDLFIVSVQSAMLRARSASAMAYNLTLSTSKTVAGRPTAADDCLELLDISLELLADVVRSDKSKKRTPHDIQTWLSAALTNQVTCSDNLGAGAGTSVATANHQARSDMRAQVDVLYQYISNALALHASMGGGVGGVNGRRLSEEFPEWVTAADRKLLEASPEEILPHAVVAKDGSGTHCSIAEAITFAGVKAAGGRSVIYVKAGVYREYINIPTKQKYVTLMGDGKGKSVIIGSRNAEGGWTTYKSATVAAMGAGFIAKGLTIINDSGPAKHQAVALRVGGDQSVVFQCSVQGYQDTLYSYANRQFYRDCDVSGTVDFIFGNSAVVFQNCFIQPRRPGGGQRNSITAQGRTDPNQNTGISVQGCTVSGDTGGAPTFLGRPWQRYSRVVFMETELGGVVNSAGWEEWSGGFGLSTLYYGEFRNTGAGSATAGRVRWPGVHSAMSVEEASKFTVGSFIAGGAWLPGTGVGYNGGL